MFGSCFAILYFSPFSFAIILRGKKRAGCFAIIVLLVSCDCYVALPHCAVVWSAMCDSGIS